MLANIYSSMSSLCETYPISRRPKSSDSTLGRALALSAAAHMVSGAAGQYERRPHHAAQTIVESHETDPQHDIREQHERFQRRRRDIVVEARRQIAEGRLELGRFTIRANAIDIQEYQRKETNLDEIYQEYDRVSRIFRERLNAIVGAGPLTVQAFSEALIAATENYHYQGVGGFLSDLIHDKTGSCEQISHLVVSLLQDNGYGSMAFIRQYPPDATGYGHVAPMIETRYASGQTVDYDVTAGSAAFPEGSRMQASELVEAYARHFHLFAPNRDADSMHFPAQTSSNDRHPDHLPDEEGHFEYPLPPAGHNIPFPVGAVPFFANRIIAFYHIPPRRRPTTRAEVMRERHFTAYEVNQAFLGTTVHNVLLDNHLFVGDARQSSQDMIIDTFPSLNNTRLESLSHDLRIIESVAAVEPNPVRKAELYGRLAATYEALSIDAHGKMRFRAALHAERMREHYVRQGQAVLARSPITAPQFLAYTQQLPATEESDDHPTYERSEAMSGLTSLLFLGSRGQELVLHIVREFLNHETTVPANDLHQVLIALHSACRYPPIQEEALQLLEQAPPDLRVEVLFWFNLNRVTVEGPTLLAREARAHNELLEWYRDAVNSQGQAHQPHKRSFHEISQKVAQLTAQGRLSPEMHDALIRFGLDLFYPVFEEVFLRRQIHYPFPDREDLLQWLRTHSSPMGDRILRYYERWLVTP